MLLILPTRPEVCFLTLLLYDDRKFALLRRRESLNATETFRPSI